MSDNSVFKKNWNDITEEDVSYSRLCLSALLSVFFGLGTFLVYFTPWFFFLGVIAIFLSLFALWSIRSAEGILTGTRFAYFGLSSAVIAIVSIASFWGTYQYGVRSEANQFFKLWFAALQQGDIPQAKGYQSIYSHRSKTADTEKWWKEQYDEKYAHRAIHQYVEDKLTRVLMALGNKANISYYKTLLLNSERDLDIITCVYAVSYPADSGKAETFFVKISAKRIFPPTGTNFKAAGWRLEGVPAFYLPEEFKSAKSAAVTKKLPEN